MSAGGGVLIVDEVFRFPSETRSAIEINNDVVILGSLSKTHGLPGLRLGWIAARPERLSRYRTLRQYMSLTLNAFTVAIGCSVLEKVPKFDRIELVKANRSLVTDWADRLHGHISISAPSGGTTICVMTDAPIDEGALFSAALDAGVLIAPGNSCFGRDIAQTWFRIGYGTETKELKLGLAVC